MDKTTVVESVDLVFHLAASVSLDENIVQAYNIQFNGTKWRVDLCKEIKNLKCFIHCSTAYSNCIYGQDLIEEKFYDNVDMIKTSAIMSNIDEKGSNEFTAQ